MNGTMEETKSVFITDRFKAVMRASITIEVVSYLVSLTDTWFSCKSQKQTLGEIRSPRVLLWLRSRDCGSASHAVSQFDVRPDFILRQHP